VQGSQKITLLQFAELPKITLLHQCRVADLEHHLSLQFVILFHSGAFRIVALAHVCVTFRIVILLSICPSFDLIIHVTMLFNISCLSFYTCPCYILVSCPCYILVFIVSLLSIWPSFDLIIHVTMLFNI
jgi:hypothetical protein